jgi:hypothetical protein
VELVVQAAPAVQAAQVVRVVQAVPAEQQVLAVQEVQADPVVVVVAVILEQLTTVKARQITVRRAAAVERVFLEVLVAQVLILGMLGMLELLMLEARVEQQTLL